MSTIILIKQNSTIKKTFLFNSKIKIVIKLKSTLYLISISKNTVSILFV